MTIKITIRPSSNISKPVSDGFSSDYILTIPIADRTNTRISRLDNTSGTTSRITRVGERNNFANILNSVDIYNIKIKSSKKQLFKILSLITIKDKERKPGANSAIFEISFDNIIYNDISGQEHGLTWNGNDLILDLTENSNDFDNLLNSDNSFNVEKVININDYDLDADPVNEITNYNDKITGLKGFYNWFENSFEEYDAGNLNVDNIYSLLKEHRKWVEIFGFTRVEEILEANANGFILENTFDIKSVTNYASHTLSDADLTNINIISNKKYKGFSLTEGATINTSAVTGNGYASDGATRITTRTLSIGNKDVNATPGIYTKWHIDALRSIAEEANANTVNDNQEKKDFFKNFGDPNKTSSKDLWGFKPGDVVLTGTGPKYSVNSAGAVFHDLKSYDSMNTKKGFAIQDFAAGKLDGFLDLVFFDNDFEEINFGYIPKVNMTNPATWTNDLTNKVSKKSELLDRYFWSAKLNNNYYNPYASPDIPNDNIKAIEETYKEVKEILEAIEDTYSNDDKIKARTAKNILETASKNTKFKNENLKAEIIDKLTEIEDVLNDVEFVEDNKIEEAKKGRSETSKELLDKAKKKITETQLTKLVEIIDLLEKANAATDEKNYNEDALIKLRGIKVSTEADEKAVWKKVVKSFKEKDGDKTWFEKGLKKLEGILTNAKNTAKTVIDEIKKDDPYNSSGIDNLTSIININEIKDLFKLCHDAYKLQEQEVNDRIFNALKLKKISSSSCWTSVNNYRKNDKDKDENEGYATGALKYLQEFAEKELEQHNKILVITDEAELERVLGEISASLKGAQKEEFGKMKTLMYKGRLKLSNNTTKNEEEKLLEKLLSLNICQYKEDTKDNLNEIENKISELRAYKDASETDKKGKAMEKAGGDALKSALTLFIAKMEDKKNAMKAIVEELKKKNNGQVISESEWKIWHKIALAGATLAILAVIVYFLKKNSSEEGE